MTRDVPTFLDSDCPALLAWSFGPEDAGRITRPVLYMGGSASGTWFDEVRDLLLGWFPGAESRTVEGRTTTSPSPTPPRSPRCSPSSSPGIGSPAEDGTVGIGSGWTFESGRRSSVSDVGGHRLYSDADAERVRFIIAARHLAGADRRPPC